MANRWKQPDYIPTPMEIEQKCEEIRRRWSERERQRRMRFVSSSGQGPVGANRIESIRAELDQCEAEAVWRSQSGERGVDTVQPQLEIA